MKNPQYSKAAILTELKKPLVVDLIKLPKTLKYGQVLVKLHYSGICGSQLGEIDGIKGSDKYLPHLLGHEGSGTVLDIGDGVKNVSVDDRVVLHWREGEGINSETPKYFLQDTEINAGWVTTFNEFAVISENRLTKVSTALDLKLAPLLGCAITTGFGVVENDAKIKIGDSVVIFGSGGIGLSMIQAAKLKGAYPIIAVDIFENRLELAKECGADHTIRHSNIEATNQTIKNFTNEGLDVFIDNTGLPEIIELGYRLIHKNGSLVLVGVPKFDQNISIHTLPIHFGKRIKGSEGGGANPSKDIPKFANLIELKKIDVSNQVTYVCCLDDINDAISDMRSGKAIGRTVIKFD
tara:strand:+ start:16438 stop:17490 length:1053 start_codon:yes stop_codon:yes gene_type:complete